MQSSEYLDLLGKKVKVNIKGDEVRFLIGTMKSVEEKALTLTGVTLSLFPKTVFQESTIKLRYVDSVELT